MAARVSSTPWSRRSNAPAFTTCLWSGSRRARIAMPAKSMAASPLDEAPGIGPARKRALLMHFGTGKAVKGAALEDLEKAPGISKTMARQLYDYFHPRG